MATRRPEVGAHYIVDDHYAPRHADPEAATVVPLQRDDHSWVHRAERYRWEVSASIGSEGGLTAVTVEDISVGGLYVRSDIRLAVDAAVEIVLPIPGGSPVRVGARVVWTRDGHGLGLQLTEVPAAVQARLAALVGSLAANVGRGTLSYSAPDFDLVDDLVDEP